MLVKDKNRFCYIINDISSDPKNSIKEVIQDYLNEAKKENYSLEMVKIASPYIYGLSIPVILLFAKPLVDAVNNKSVLVKCITGFLFAIFIWALILPVVAEFAYRMYHM